MCRSRREEAAQSHAGVDCSHSRIAIAGSPSPTDRSCSSNAPAFEPQADDPLSSASPGGRHCTARAVVTGLRDFRDDRRPRGGPRQKATHKVGRTREAELLQRDRCKARLVALVAHKTDSPAKIAAQPWIVVTRRGIAAPFEHVAGMEDRARNAAVPRALGFGTDVDEERAIAESVADGR